MTKDQKYMAFVRRLAINSNMKMKFAACLVIRNEIISIGANSEKSHPLQKKFAKNRDAIFKHAEVDCIINALRHVDQEDLSKATLYIHRVKKLTKDHKYWSDGLSEPCCGCKQAIDYFKIKKVVYSTDTDKQYSEILYGELESKKK